MFYNEKRNRLIKMIVKFFPGTQYFLHVFKPNLKERCLPARTKPSLDRYIIVENWGQMKIENCVRQLDSISVALRY